MASTHRVVWRTAPGRSSGSGPSEGRNTPASAECATSGAKRVSELPGHGTLGMNSVVPGRREGSWAGGTYRA